MKYDTIRWKNNRVELIDQRLLPAKKVYVSCETAKDIFDAIRKMKIRGAPAIGVSGGYGVYLGVRNARSGNYGIFKKKTEQVVKYLASSRPTARNLFWALERMSELVLKNKGETVSRLKELVLEEAHAICEDDKKICHLIGENGKVLIKNGARILTHCNAGGLATAGYGTALGVIFSARKKITRVYADETRPVLQGARLTVWELVSEGIPTTLICDNMAASLMAKGEITAVVVGADRISANGDTANKIGTYNVAVLAAYHKIPFYVAAPVSTFDLSIPTGKYIPIEERSAEEVRKIKDCYITVRKVDVVNPAFDVTPRELITAIITEKGIIRKPDKVRVAKVVKNSR
ncbi:MAG: S-methyl-5-thioribose-1-phosphate isomerase [Candidatus Omnitrophota bacterium]